MIILHLVSAFQFRGAEIAALQLSKELVARGHTVYFVALYRSDDAFKLFEGLHTVALDGRRGAIPDACMLFRLVKLVRRLKPDVVQANAGDTLKYAALASLFPGVKLRIVFRNASMVGQYIRSKVQRIANRILYTRVVRVLSVSRHSMTDFISVFPTLANRTIVIPNGIELGSQIFYRSQHLNISVIHVGGFTFEKNHSGLLRILKRLLVLEPTAHLTLIGAGPLIEVTKAEVSKLGLDSQVRFAGTMREPSVLIAEADVLVLPSIIEGLPAVILEAFYCRTPVVCYDVGGISEVVRHRETGWLVSLNDESAFVDAIVDALHGDKRSAIIEAAYGLVIRDYNMTDVANRIITAYQSAIS